MAALALALAAATTIPFVRFDDSPLDLRDPNTESVQTLVDLLQDRRFDPFRAAVLAKDAAEAEAIAAKLRALPEVKRVETAADLVPADQDEKLAQLGDLALMMTPVIAPARAQAGARCRRRYGRRSTKLQAAADGAASRSPAARALAGALHSFQSTDSNLEVLQTSLLETFPGMLVELTESLNAEAISPADVPPSLLARRQTPDGQVLVEAFPNADLRDETARGGGLPRPCSLWCRRPAARRSPSPRPARRWCSRSSKLAPLPS